MLMLLGDFLALVFAGFVFNIFGGALVAAFHNWGKEGGTFEKGILAGLAVFAGWYLGFLLFMHNDFTLSHDAYKNLNMMFFIAIVELVLFLFWQKHKEEKKQKRE